MKKKTLISIIAVALVLCVSVGGVLAYLMDKTNSVTNTFTVGDINITLAETTGDDYKMIPGETLDKDPLVTVKAGSETCWLFVKVDKSENFDTYMTYTMATGWTELESGVFYREVAANAKDDQVFGVLADDRVTVKGTVTKTLMISLTEATYPKLTFTAYAIQKAGFNTAAAAWAEASK